VRTDDHQQQNLQIPPDVHKLLHHYGIRPKKDLGQNFLTHRKSLETIVTTAQLEGSETVLEIGAGIGTLTYYLALAAGEVIAVELDRRFMPILNEVLRNFENVRCVQGDILKLRLEEIIGEVPYIVVANIPYHLTSNLIRKLLENSQPPERIILTIQREVAERIIAQPGEMNLLAISVQLYGVPELKGNIPAKFFFPQPKVNSSIIKISFHSEKRISHELIPYFFRIVRAGFQQKRKKLRNSLSAGLHLDLSQVETLLEQSGIDPHSRPQMLEIDQWIHLTKKAKNLLVGKEV
jgi:16S rRNA (adenine1518-N6/adenine1519-N6)-dimethyltransferase